MTQVEHLAAELTQRGLTLATAESCTGGGLSHQLTSIPGSSAFFLGGVIAYHNDVKRDWLGVPARVLHDRGAVSLEVATAMAEGCRSRFRTDLAISITGIAGPGGGSAEKPVGLVFVAVASVRGVRVVEHHFEGDRARVREQAISTAVRMVREAIAG